MIRDQRTAPQIETSRITSVDVAVLQDLFDHVPDVTFFVKDAACRYIAVNESLTGRLGLKHRSQLIGKRLDEVCEGDLGRIPTEQDSEVLKTGLPLINHLELHRSRTQEPGWCLTTKIPLRNENANVVGLVGISSDVRIPTEPQEIPVSFANALTEFESSLAAEVTPAWLAKKSKLSSQRVARLTKKLFGLTPSQLITKTRIAAASRILKETDKSIKEVATACGFTDHSAFSRTFRAATGVSPSVFRQS
ncbi:AraC family transcriptional regulator [Rubinisphaera italica]|uniref:HTH-type transcriptional activator RhaS n=1 Tax=Rubinisphaera italica TaxID=2527969 RepID=A0A5C5XLV6_9PLAN|nr:helix-turn-helix domain-containing protein [Rubinisphaera italica]TWT63688.1 HTH-type transcriptional activator RhaS [Rubinisphaera italica]